MSIFDQDNQAFVRQVLPLLGGYHKLWNSHNLEIPMTTSAVHFVVACFVSYVLCRAPEIGSGVFVDPEIIIFRMS